MKTFLRKYYQFLILFIPVLLYLPFLGKIEFPKGNPYSDLVISHLPNAIFINTEITKTGQIPLWNDTIMSGYPFIADPLSGIWYPPIWLANLIPTAVSFNILFLLHIFFEGLGLFYLLRKEGVRTNPALVAALVFECLPKIWSHYAAGHVTLIFAVSWTPWLLLSAKKRWRDNSKFFTITTETLILLAIILSDIRWIVYAAAIWIFFSLSEALAYSKSTTQKRKIKEILFILGKWSLHIFGQIVFALFISAAFLLPFLEFVSLSTRASLTASQNLFLSLSPINLINLVIPNIGGYAEWVLYIGGLGIICLLICLFNKKLRQKTGFWLIGLAICLFFSLGANIPGMSFLFSLPIIKLMRVPARINFLTGFAICIMIGFTLNWFEEEKRIASWLKLTVIAILFFTLLFGIGISLINQRFELSIFWAFFILLGFLILFLLFIHHILKPTVFYSIIISLVLIDLLGVNFLSTDFKDYSQIENKKEAQILQTFPGFSSNRIYSPSFSISQLDASRLGLSMANGIDPLVLKIYSSYLESASGIPQNGYSVTVPSLVTGDPQIDNQGFFPDASSLGLLNVKYLVAAYPISASGFQLLNSADSLWIYENLKVLSKAWVQSNSDSYPTFYRQVDSFDFSPNKITITASGPGTLVLSEVAYPGWTVFIDGKAGQISTFDELLRSVDLLPGSHEIKLEYHPTWLKIGMIISGGSDLLLIIYFIFFRNQKKVKSNQKI